MRTIISQPKTILPLPERRKDIHPISLHRQVLEHVSRPVLGVVKKSTNFDLHRAADR